MKSAVRPHEILLVVVMLLQDRMETLLMDLTKKLGIDGIIMTKMDGDSKRWCGASAKKVTGKPIKFLGTGEKPCAEPIRPSISRILGIGKEICSNLLRELSRPTMRNKPKGQSVRSVRTSSHS